jgi:hypothetical protein
VIGRGRGFAREFFSSADGPGLAIINEAGCRVPARRSVDHNLPHTSAELIADQPETVVCVSMHHPSELEARCCF